MGSPRSKELLLSTIEQVREDIELRLAQANRLTTRAEGLGGKRGGAAPEPSDLAGKLLEAVEISGDANNISKGAAAAV